MNKKTALYTKIKCLWRKIKLLSAKREREREYKRQRQPTTKQLNWAISLIEFTSNKIEDFKWQK